VVNHLQLDDVYRQIRIIWQQAMNVEVVDIDQTFTTVGGDSLSAIFVSMLIEKKFGCKIDITLLLSSATIRKLGQFIVFRKDLDRNIVCHQHLGAFPPFFGVHPFFGFSYPYADLSRLLGPDYPIYGFQSCGLDGGLPLKTFEDMAARYILAMKTVQPIGPYYIGGWSMGGLIAFEMARQLVRQGEQISLLAVIDVAANSVEKFLVESPILTQFSGAIRIFRNAFRFHHSAVRNGANLAWTKLFLSFIRKMFIPMVRVAWANRNAAIRYKLQEYSGHITLFHTADPRFGDIHDPTLGWANFAQAGVDAFLLPGDHFTLSREPNISLLAESLRSAIHSANNRIL
jgi:thioesterase domain-containing protein/acyl carrier protein